MQVKPSGTKTAQIAQDMRHRIAAGEWEVGQPIPGLTDLETEYGVSFGTIRAAQKVLVDERLLSEPQQGIPTHVIARPAALDAHEALDRLRGTYRSLGDELEQLAAIMPGSRSQPVNLSNLNNHQVHDFARFHAAAAAIANGSHRVKVSGPQTRLIVDDRTVQVSSRRQPGSPWQVSAAHPVVDDAVAVIFVDLSGDAPDFYIAPDEWVRTDVKRHFAAWLESKGGVRPRNPDSDHHAIELDRIRQWHQRWDVLG
jgi:DNA-binding transcriptional regulator YhcF (GntR family)